LKKERRMRQKGRLIIDGNQVYEIDEECMKKKDCEERERLERERAAEGARRKQGGKRRR
jgi:hypothetical protein